MAFLDNTGLEHLIGKIATKLAGKSDTGHSHNDLYYTESEINTKLSGKSDTSHTHSAYVNQNAFSNVIVGSTTVAADSATDSLTLAGSNVTITPDATNDKITIGITKTNVTDALGYTPPTTNTTYNNATTSAAGLMSTTDKSKLDGIASGAEVNQNAFAKVVVGTTTIEADAKSDTLTLTAGSNVTLSPSASGDSITIAATDTTYSDATTSAAGLMTAAMVTKLNGIATGANKYSHPTTSGNKHIPSGGSSGQILRWSADGTAAWGADNNTTYTAGAGIDVSSSNVISNSGVRSISTGTSNGTISVNTNGTSANVSVKGLGSAAYTASTAYDAAGTGAAQAASALASAKSYADGIKNDLLNGAGTAYDTLKELGDLIDDNKDAISALETVASSKANASDLTTHTGNSTIHVTSTNKTNWTAAYTHSTSTHAPTNAEKNQNAFSNVKVGSTTIEADTTTDTLTLVAGSNITLTPDATNDQVTIAATNTTYSAATQSAQGLMSAADKKKLDGIAEGANNYTYTLPTASSTLGGVKTTSSVTSTSGLTACPIISGVVYYKDTNTKYTHPASGVTAGTYKSVTVDANGHVTAGTNPTTLSGYGITDAAAKSHSHDAATTSAAGFMTADMVTKLNGIATGANAYTHPNSGVTAGTYKSVTVNAAGHVTGGSNPTTLSGYGITDAASKTHGHDAATTSAAGFMTAAMVTKLNGIADNANKYSHPTTAGNKHIPSGGASGNVLKWSSSGTATWGSLSASDIGITAITTAKISELIEEYRPGELQ